MAHAHKRKICQHCHGIISTCKCMSDKKETTFGTCEKCAKWATPPTPPTPPAPVEPVPAFLEGQGPGWRKDRVVAERMAWLYRKLESSEMEDVSRPHKHNVLLDYIEMMVSDAYDEGNACRCGRGCLPTPSGEGDE